MSTQAPQLDKGEMAAAERANLRLSEQIMVLMAKALRNYANHYPPKLQKSLSDPKAETKVDISIGDEKLFSATLGADGKVKETQINNITDAQAQELAKALSKQQGEMLDSGKIRDIRVLVNGVALFEAKDGKVLGNNLPPEFLKAIAQMIQPQPPSISVSTNPPNQSPQIPQQAPVIPQQAPEIPQQAPAATNPVSNVAQKSNTPTTQQEQLNRGAKSTNPPKQATQQHQEAPNGTKPIPNVARKDTNSPIAGQDQLNRALIAEAKKSLDRLVPANSSVVNRQWKHEKYTVTQKDSVISVYVAETNTTIRADADVITGNARQKDVEALSTVNASIDQQLGKPVAKQTEAEL